MEVLISKVLINICISHDEFASVNNVMPVVKNILLTKIQAFKKKINAFMNCAVCGKKKFAFIKR